MNILEAIAARHSVRKYKDKEIPRDIIAALQDKIAECNKVGNLNIQLVLNETRAFTGMLAYGQFSGVKNYLVMVGKKSKDLDERSPSTFASAMILRASSACSCVNQPLDMLLSM